MKTYILVFIEPYQIVEGVAPKAIVPKVFDVREELDKIGLTTAYLVDFSVGLYGIYDVKSLKAHQTAMESLKENSPVKEVESAPIYEEEDQEPVIEEESFNIKAQETERPEVSTQQEIENEGKWVKIYPQMIHPGKRVRCRVGSNAGRVAIIRNVVRPGAPDSETFVLATKGEMVETNSEGERNSVRAKDIANKAKMQSIFSKPDNVTIEWVEPLEDTIVTGENVGGITLNRQEVTAAHTHTNLTKKKLCDEFLIWQS